MRQRLGLLLLVFALLAGSAAAAGSAEAAPPSQTLYVFDLKAFIRGKGMISQKVAYDYQKLATALQGIANRDAPRIYYEYESNSMATEANVETDKYWLDKLNQPGEYLHDYAKDDSQSFSDLLAIFRSSVNGVAVWDEEVPATANVASTLAGVDNLLPVRYDPSPGSAYTELVTGLGLPVVVDLRGKFTGTGVIPDIGRASTGSAKNDAYLWAKALYLDTGKTNPMLMTNSLDGASWSLNDVEGETQYGAKVISAYIPEQIEAGATAAVSLTVQNTGTATWKLDELYRLGALSSNSILWTNMPDGGHSLAVNDQRVFLNAADTIAPGETKKFRFALKAPDAQGQIVFSANVVRDGVAWMAGTGITRTIDIVAPSSPPVGPPPAIDPPDDPNRIPATVEDTPPAEADGLTLAAQAIAENVPNAMNPGDVMNISLTLRNKGTQTWAEILAGEPVYVRLATLENNGFQWGETNGGYSLAPNNARVFMNGEVDTEEEYTFRFTIEAPQQAGVYTFAAQLIRDGKAWFGPKVTKSITVGESSAEPVEIPVNSDTFSYPDLFNNSLPNADYYIAKKAFFFDLSPDQTSIPNDDRSQPLGTDYRTLIELLAAQNAKAGENIFTVGGFVPWFLKYTNFADPLGSNLTPVEAEWTYADIVSRYNAQKDADAYGLTGLSNASVFRHVPLAAAYEQNNDKGNNGKTLEEGKKYVTFFMGDFDAGAWTSSALPILWDDPQRGELPLAWSFVPNTSERVPQMYNYLYETMGPNDYFVAGDNGAGYLNPMMLMTENRPDSLPDFLDVWESYNVGLYDKFDLDITGFLISGNSQSTPLRVQEVYSRISPAGVGNNAGFDQDIVNGTPFAPVTDMGLFRSDTEQFGKDLARALKRNQFLNIRVILTKPSDIVAAVQYVQTNHPELNFEVVDPYTYFRFYKEAEGDTGTIDETKQYQAVKAGAPITIDGVAKAEEWEKAAGIVVSPLSDDVVAYGTVWGAETDAADLTSRYRIRWDDQHLYLLEERTDDSLHFTETGAQMYLSDATMLFLDLGHDKQGGVYKNGDYALFLTPSGPDEQPHMFIREGRNEGQIEREFTDGRIAGVITDSGYTMEVAIPWSALQTMPFAPGVDRKVGMSLLATDQDGSGNWGQIMWVGDGDNQENWADMKFVGVANPTEPGGPTGPGSSTGSGSSSGSSTPPKVEQQDPAHEPMDKELVEELLRKSEQSEAAQLRAVSEGIKVAAATAAKPTKIAIRLPTENTVHPVYLYKIGEDGKLIYVPSKRSGGVVEAEVTEPGLYGLIEYDRSYADVPSGYWAYDVIRDLSARQIVAGVDAAQFNPASPITRAEFTAMLARAAGLKPAAGSSFADVAADKWYAGYIAAARQAGWTKGESADSFNPSGIITREQMAVMMTRILKNASGTKDLPAMFKDDESVSSWARDAVRMAAELELLKGNPAGNFLPLKMTTRAEGAQAIYNLLRYLEK